jgi:predicted DNA-binding transcriptional regulator AlpA
MAKRISQNPRPDSIANFDHLPNCAFVRRSVVEQLFGYSGTTVWRRVADRRIPEPRKLSHRVTAWNVGELRAALAATLTKEADRDTPSYEETAVLVGGRCEKCLTCNKQEVQGIPHQGEA